MSVHPHIQQGTNQRAIVAGGLVSAGRPAVTISGACLTAAQSGKDDLSSEQSKQDQQSNASYERVSPQHRNNLTTIHETIRQQMKEDPCSSKKNSPLLYQYDIATCAS
jgi:hypothetical protein